MLHWSLIIRRLIYELFSLSSVTQRHTTSYRASCTQMLSGFYSSQFPFFFLLRGAFLSKDLH